jgi:hypothetical protein
MLGANAPICFAAACSIGFSWAHNSRSCRMLPNTLPMGLTWQGC